MDVYDVTLRFECESPTLAACLAHELVMALKPIAGTALATNPRIWASESSSGHNLDNEYVSAATHERDMAHRYVHAYAVGNNGQRLTVDNIRERIANGELAMRELSRELAEIPTTAEGREERTAEYHRMRGAVDALRFLIGERERI